MLCEKSDLSEESSLSSKSLITHTVVKIPKICAYVLDHDTGKAPKIDGDTCILSECKKKDIRKSADVGDWIVGIGGKGLGRSKGNKGRYYGKLIYAMKVQRNINFPESKEFYFFGDNAIEIPKDLGEICPEKMYRVKYFREPTYSTLFSDFNSFMRRHQIGRHGEHCDMPTGQHLLNVILVIFFVLFAKSYNFVRIPIT